MLENLEHPPESTDWRERLQRTQGPEYWRCLDEWSQSEAFQKELQREFPEWARDWTDAVSRRRFLSLAAASLLLAGIGCGRRGPSKIVPYVRQPEQIVPGRPLFYATAFPFVGQVQGLLVESTMGRPIKIEGNPEHPSSGGATDTFAQASILTLYDPDRSDTIRYRGRPSTWIQARAMLFGIRERLQKSPDERLHLLTGKVLSPTLLDQLQRLRETYKDKVFWYQYEPVDETAASEGARLLFGEPAQPLYDLSKADVVVSLDADLLSCGAGNLRHARDFANRRRVVDQARAQLNLSRLYVVESTPTSTGLFADHHFPLANQHIPAFAAQLAAEIAGLVKGNESSTLQELLKSLGGTAATELKEQKQAVSAIARDLTAEGRRGKTLIVAGPYQPPAVHALAYLLNQTLGNFGTTVRFVPPVGEQGRPLAELCQALTRGEVRNLLLLDSNPVYDAPADLRLGDLLSKVPLRVHVSQYDDETSQLCHWHIPLQHYLETWSDVRAADGTATIIQPLIDPLYESAKSLHEVLGTLSEQPDRSALEWVRAYWQKLQPANSGEFETFWRRTLHDGVMPGTSFPEKKLTNGNEALRRLETELKPLLTAAPGLEIVFRPDPTVYDGRFANNGWLQELPKPLTKLTWDNVALVSEKTARELGLRVEEGMRGGKAIADLIELRLPNRDPVRLPAWISPGHADGSITVFLGYGRRRAGRVGTGIGFDVYPLRSSHAPWAETGLEVRKTGEQYALACTQLHHLMHNRDLVKSVPTPTEYQKHPDFAQHHEGHHDDAGGRIPLTLHPTHSYDGYKWGMVIDLSTCVGCSACIVACQAENNIPVVGKDQVLNGREMHWLRVDSYYTGAPENPRALFQPVPCMHCEKAPCEVVCPVEATVHSSEGLNDMVYNRCVGTRYCSNNCPYKVRRFNFLQYSDYATESLKLLHNPEVTVRTRGVMEKCTYCVQRISGARITAEKEGRKVQDGEILTACQAVCPTKAIVFGDLNDRRSTVAKWASSSLDYALLGELNTQPRTTYLAAVKNRNPELDGEHAHG